MGPHLRDDAGFTTSFPCTQLGWGVVNMSNIEPIIEHLNGTATLPSVLRMSRPACRRIKQPGKRTGASERWKQWSIRST